MWNVDGTTLELNEWNGIDFDATSTFSPGFTGTILAVGDSGTRIITVNNSGEWWVYSKPDFNLLAAGTNPNGNTQGAAYDPKYDEWVIQSYSSSNTLYRIGHSGGNIGQLILSGSTYSPRRGLDYDYKTDTFKIIAPKLIQA